MFVSNGQNITNPFASECSRFQVDPVEHYGFVVTDMGGGSKALKKVLDDGWYVILTDHTGLDIATDVDKWIMGLYNSEGELIDLIEEFQYDVAKVQTNDTTCGIHIPHSLGNNV